MGIKVDECYKRGEGVRMGQEVTGKKKEECDWRKFKLLTLLLLKYGAPELLVSLIVPCVCVCVRVYVCVNRGIYVFALLVHGLDQGEVVSLGVCM